MVEDNPADAGLVREALEEHAVECELVLITNGERAIDFILRLDEKGLPCPNLVILDLNLPKRPGADILRSIRASRCGHIPVVILTSSDSQKDKDDAARLGASGYFQKPSRLDEFIELGRVFKTMLDGQSG